MARYGARAMVRFRLVMALLVTATAAHADDEPATVSAVRRGSWAAMGASLVAGAVGGYFAISSSLARSAVRTDSAAGTFTQEQLDVRDLQAIRQGRVANGLF